MAHRLVAMHETFLLVEGILSNTDGTAAVKPKVLRSLNWPSLGIESHHFRCERADSPAAARSSPARSRRRASGSDMSSICRCYNWSLAVHLASRNWTCSRRQRRPKSGISRDRTAVP